MKKLTKEQVAKVTESVEVCSFIQEKIQKKIDEYNEYLAQWDGSIRADIAEYNDKIGELRGVYESAASDAQEYFDERSETWQSSDKGEAYSDWINQLESIDLEDLEVELPDAIDEPMYHDWDNPENWLPPNEPGE